MPVAAVHEPEALKCGRLVSLLRSFSDITKLASALTPPLSLHGRAVGLGL